MPDRAEQGVRPAQGHDRTHFTPPHRGPSILPNSPFFSQLLRHAHRKGRLAIRDVHANVEKTYAHLLSDALHLRRVLESSIPSTILETVETDREDATVGVLAPGGYQYVVAVLAVLSLGLTLVPMSVAAPVEEASFFVRKARQVVILASSNATALGEKIATHVNNEPTPEEQPIPPRAVQCIPIVASLEGTTEIAPTEILISSDTYLSDNSPAVVIFTSGTTGPPKGAVLRRGYIHEASRAIADHFSLVPTDVVLHLLPVHHVSGLAINILPFLLAGACIEFRSGAFDSAWTWERWRRGGLTLFLGVPTIYMRMKQYYEQHIASLPTSEREAYENGVLAFRAMMCGTSALPRPVQDFWTGLRNGEAILTRYGSTEVGAVLRVPLEPGDTPDGSVGVVAPGVDLKLSPKSNDADNGSSFDNVTGTADVEEGEIRVKSPELLSKYLGDDTATAASFDEEGYFMTGDVARREGKYYFIVGRASQDILKSGGYKISALDVEREVLALPYISEVMVVGVDDEEFGQRVAAVVSLQGDTTGKGSEEHLLDIDKFREDLRSRMANYKLPTLLRVMEGDLPKTASGKVLKKVLGPQLFPSPEWQKMPEVQVWRSTKSSAKL